MWRVTSQFRAHDNSTSLATWDVDLPRDTRWSVQLMTDKRAVAQCDGARVIVWDADWIAVLWKGEPQ